MAMKRSKPSSNLCNPCCLRVQELESVVNDLEQKQKFADYVINHMKAELRLCYDTLKSVNKSAKEAMEEQEAMSETLNARLERGYHLTYNGDEIYYRGEETYAEWKAKNSSISTS